MSPVALGPWLWDQSDGTLIKTLSEYDLFGLCDLRYVSGKRYLPLKVRKFIDHLSARLLYPKGFLMKKNLQRGRE